MSEWRKNPQWSFSCCLALLLPLNELQGEVHGLAGRNVLKHQWQTGKVEMLSISAALKDSGAVAFDLEEGAPILTDEEDRAKATTTWIHETEPQTVGLSQQRDLLHADCIININDEPRKTYESSV